MPCIFQRTPKLVIIVLFVWPLALGKAVTLLVAQYYSQFTLTHSQILGKQ